MEKVVDYGVFGRTLGQADISGARSKQTFLKELKEEYPPEDGWRIVSTEYTGQSPEGWTVFVFLQKYA